MNRIKLRCWTLTTTLFGLGFGCSSVSNSDPSFWKPTTDLGGKDAAALFQAPVAGNPGDPNVPPTGPVPTGPVPTTQPTTTPTGPVPTTQPTTTPTGPVPTTQPTTTPTGPVPTTQPTTTPTGPVPTTDPPIDPTQPPPPPPPPGNSGTCSFTFSVTTVTANGRYAPKNVGAIWITNASGQFVKTLQWWGLIRLGNATAWQTSSGGNKVDAVSGATRPSHGPLTASWDCTDVNRQPVPNGSYNANVTFAEADAFPFFGPPEIKASVTFDKGVPADRAGADTANFKSLHVVVQ